MSRSLAALLFGLSLVMLVACGGQSTLISGDGDGDVDSDVDGDVDGDGDGDSCSGPGYPDECALVDYFQCGFEVSCEDGVISAYWHQHVMCGDDDWDERIYEYSCEHVCEHGCRDPDLIVWASDGAELVASTCGAPGVCEAGTCRYCGLRDGGGIGAQHCVDGVRWTRCAAVDDEAQPEECAGVATYYSREWEECCVASGYCCADAMDLDGDGEYRDSVGSCESGGCVGVSSECTPGACRICTPPEYDGFGSQTCTAAGTWGSCFEGPPIEECFLEGWFSPAEEACLVMQGYCTIDFWDLDGDDDRWESLGACGGDGCAGGGRSPWTCVPGTCRYCDPSEYDGPGRQTCAEDGSGWSSCVEHLPVIEECAHLDGWYSPLVEECCIEAGYCCQDTWDRDHDGDIAESFGACYADGC